MPIVRIVIRGHVQGVGFRNFVVREADARRLDGWVRNRRDHSVEAVLAGASETVRAMIEICRRGPAGSYVETIEEYAGSEDDLTLRPPGETFSWLETV